MSLEIRPLEALYPPPPPYKKCALKGCDLSGPRGRYAHAYGICAPFDCMSLKKICRGWWYNAARGLNSRDIALFS